MKEEAEKMAKKDHDQDGKIETGKAEYLGSRIRAAKMAGKMKEEAELEEAFPTVADAKKRMDAGKTSSGSVTKTKTGLVHKRDYKDDDNDADDTPKKTKGYGARQNFKRSTRVNEQKLSFTEMLQLYNEAGVEVISKIVPQTVKFGDTEVEVIDANIVNGAVGITVAEEVDNETFTKEVEAQKEKNAGRGKKAEVAKPSVQAVKQEEVEQIDELSKDTLGNYIKKAHYAGGMADFKHGRIADKRGDSKDKMALSKTSQKREKGINKAVNRLTKEDVQMDERTLTSSETEKKEDYVKGMKKSVSGFKARYGDDAKSVMYATATKMAKKD